MKSLKFFFLVGALAVVGLASTASAKWKAGQELPDLSAYKLEGKIPEIKGKVVLLDFWATWCPPCRASFPIMDELQAEFKEDLVVLAVSVDEEPEAVDKWVSKSSPKFAILKDPEHALVSEAGIETMPTSFIVDGEGVIHHVHVGFYKDKTKEAYLEEIRALIK